MNKLAVFFPGIGYTVDKPLMYYSRKLAAEAGYEILLMNYTGFPKKIRGDSKRMMESLRIARKQTEEMLSDVDLNSCSSLLFVGKSIGTIVAAECAADTEIADRTRQILYTPLEETFSFPLKNAVVFTGDDDPWVGKTASRIPDLCSQHSIPCTVIPGGNHSLECGDALCDLKNLQIVMSETKQFLLEEFQYQCHLLKPGTICPTTRS